MKKVLVIGAGPAGMIAAGVCAEKGNKVTLVEKNPVLGRKLKITGKGRCNITNASDPDILLKDIRGNPHFLYSAFYTFGSEATMDLFERLGVPLKVERGNRVFPVSDEAGDVVGALKKYLGQNRVAVCLNCQARDIIIKNRSVHSVLVGDREYLVDSVIVATGGLSYPGTGSTGEGYIFARNAGHKVSKLIPALVPLITQERWVSDLQGLSLRNISIKLRKGRKTIYSDFGEMLFTHFGVSGPVILSSSRLISDADCPAELLIDLKPALNYKEMDARLLKDFEKYANRELKNALDDLLPRKLIPVISELSGIAEKRVHTITKNERRELLDLLKCLTLTVTGKRGWNEAIITSGGISTDELDPSTMGSKLINGLYFAGEILDVDGPTGGYNLQIAFSTGYLAGISVG